MIREYEIAQLGAKILRLQAESVDDAHAAEIQKIIEAMRDTLATTPGIGLAAPQIGVSKRIIIMASRPTSRYPDAPLMAQTVMINPAFHALSDEREKGWEGCLSVPGIRALVPRYKEIQINYVDQQGAVVEARLEGFVARVFQHEVDHLDGMVYLDRVEDSSEIVAESEYFKLGG
jgi:peptide deformylase